MRLRTALNSRPLRGHGAALPAALALAAVALLALSPAAASATEIVPTEKGPVRGTETASMYEYLGIPYAAPPVKKLRWRPPQPHAAWRKPLEATHFANHCPQTASFAGIASETEDCLYLNVFTPKPSPGTGLPVMVWIHGGGFLSGESDDYDPTRLVERGVIVVTLNYRLGTLGFLADPALSAESGDHSSGNYGLMDQQAALQWVQHNIANFGGDPNNVTIFGESAGGLSVYSQLASPLAAGLFQKAIAQSGSYSLKLPPLSAAEKEGSTLARKLGCTGRTSKAILKCMRAVPVKTLLADQSGESFSIIPPVDGHVLTKSLDTALESGEFNHVPVIGGTNHDEFTLFYKLAVEDSFGVVPPEDYAPVVGALVSSLGLSVSPTEVLAEYPLSAYEESVGRAASAIGTDAVFSCAARRAEQAISQYVPTFQYELDDPNVPQVFLPPASYPYGSYHGADLLFLFDSPTRGHAPFTEAEDQLAETMVDYWTQFARTGDPNLPTAPNWPRYETDTDLFESLKPPTPAGEGGFAAFHKCAFWDAHG